MFSLSIDGKGGIACVTRGDEFVLISMSFGSRPFYLEESFISMPRH